MGKVLLKIGYAGPYLLPAKVAAEVAALLAEHGQEVENVYRRPGAAKEFVNVYYTTPMPEISMKGVEALCGNKKTAEAVLDRQCREIEEMEAAQASCPAEAEG
jgi:hypothetical protein